MRVATCFLVLFWATSVMVYADEVSGVVISMRQYRIEGSSRIHLYLYSMDGTLKKALTDDPAFNDLEPAYSSDGKSVQFKREATDKAHQAKAGTYVIDLDTGAIRVPDPYREYFVRTRADQFSLAYAPDSTGWINKDMNSFLSPDGKFKIQRKPTTTLETQGPGPYHVIAQGKEPAIMAGLPGFIPAAESDSGDSPEICNSNPFVSDAPGFMELLFISHHLNSTDGNQVWGLDLTTMKGAKISQNGATIFHPPSASGVFAVSDALYQPLGTTGKTVNCSYLEWWDAHLKCVRFGPDLSVCFSAAIYDGDHYKNIVIP